VTRPEGLAVVVANRALRIEEGTAALDALAGELDAGVDQLLWVDAGGAGPPSAVDPPAQSISAPPGADRGTCYGLGLAAADRDLVAFTDSTTVVVPGWRAAVGGALAAGATVVGGPVMASQPRSRCSWAGFLVDYGPHAVAPHISASGDVAGNNVAYRRPALPDDGRPLWKSEVDARLRQAGIRPRVAPGMAVIVGRRYRWGDLGPGRFAAGALYGAQRSAGWPAPPRWLAAAGCVGLPALSFWRLRAQVRTDPELHGRLWRCLPEVVVGLVSWSTGEAAGYLRRRGSRTGGW
jgi:hypothetical protein